jgi:hypothetical protein
MTKVFFDSTISLDGFMAGENRGPTNPLGDPVVYVHCKVTNRWVPRGGTSSAAPSGGDRAPRISSRASGSSPKVVSKPHDIS